jgi:hypothetical protein
MDAGEGEYHLVDGGSSGPPIISHDRAAPVPEQIRRHTTG